MRTPFLNNSFLRLLIFFLCMTGSILYGLFIYNKSLEESLAATASETLAEIIMQQKFNFKTEINSELFALRSFTVLLEHHPTERETVLQTMRELAEKTNFEYITIANTRGLALSSNGQIIDISHTAAFLHAMQGKTIVGEPVPSPVRDAVIVPLSSPIYTGGNLAGILIGSYNVTRLNELLLPSFSGKGYAFVVDQSGIIIADTANAELADGDNLFLKLKDAVFEKPASFTSFMNIVTTNETGTVTYKINNEKYLAQFEPLGINKWYIIAVIPEKIIAANAAPITQKAALLTFTVVCAFTLFIFYILFIQFKSEKMRKKYFDKLEHMAFIDDLTGFNNFKRFKQVASDILHANPQSRFVFSKFDIDKFTLLNEQFGFTEGDKILKNTSLAINSVINGKTETFARIHADEFVVMYDYVSDEHLAQTRQKFEKNFALLTHNRVTASIKFPTGRYFVEPGEIDIQQIFEKVNYAHRLAKQSPEKNICHYDFKLMQWALYEKELENKMRSALSNGEFKVFLQPKYRLKDETVTGAEALVRWQKNDGSIIRPGDFIPLFEKNGFITQLDMYMFENVCKLIKNWLNANRQPVPVSVNFSRLHLVNMDFVQQIHRIAQKFEVPRNLLEIELTESTILHNESVLENVFIQLHEAGFSLSIDDFGTGYSSLGLLKNLPVDVIKFDRNFFINANSQIRAKTVISNVMRMARELGIYTVAEGVETKDYIDFLRELGCDSVQGYYYAAPMPAENFSV